MEERASIKDREFMLVHISIDKDAVHVYVCHCSTAILKWKVIELSKGVVRRRPRET